MSRKEERERLRQERLAAQASRGSSDRRRLVLGYLVAGLLSAAVVAGLVAVIVGGSDDEQNFPGNCHIQATVGVTDGNTCDEREGTEPPEIQFGDMEESAAQAKCDLRAELLPDEGNTHFGDENKGEYKTNPPTSGDHFASGEAGSGAMADGAYTTTPIESRAVHSMEHGRLEIRYAPDLPEDQQLAIKGVFDERPGGMLMFPDDDLPYAVAVSGWRRYVGCKEYSPIVLDVIRNFRDNYIGQGLEDVPLVTG